MKTDLEIGKQVQKFLLEKNIETPFNENLTPKDEKIKHIQFLHWEIMNVLGLDIENDSLKETPLRVAKMYVNELFYGLDYSNFPKCTTVENTLGNYTQPVFVTKIPVISMCEHHFQTISGTCDIKYIPNKKILGLSKFNRIVDFFSRRPQIQERLTAQIGASLSFLLETENVWVEIEASHNCVKCRGVNQDNVLTKTYYNGKDKIKHT